MKELALNTHPLTIIVAPNGARKMPADHPRLPITPQQTAEEAQRCMQQGAAMIHAHARDEAGAHTLDPAHNRRVVEALRNTLGDGLVVQLTTEAVGRYLPDEQIHLVKSVEPEAISIALRELFPGESVTQGAGFFQWLLDKKIYTQIILYDDADLRRYYALRAADVIPEKGHHLLFVLGRYAKTQQSTPFDLLPFLNVFQQDVPWAVCAFGTQEHRCMGAAMAMNGDVRVGFENNLHRYNGELASSNADLVQQVAECAAGLGRRLITGPALREHIAQQF